MKGFIPQNLELNIKSNNTMIELGVKQSVCDCESCRKGGEKSKCQKL